MLDDAKLAEIEKVARGRCGIGSKPALELIAEIRRLRKERQNEAMDALVQQAQELDMGYGNETTKSQK